jgi:hypothetical protein
MFNVLSYVLKLVSKSGEHEFKKICSFKISFSPMYIFMGKSSFKQSEYILGLCQNYHILLICKTKYV